MMKIKIIFSFFFLFFLFSLCFTSCDEDQYASYTVEFPNIPDLWREIFGEPHWRLEWIDGNGRKASASLKGSASCEIRILQEWASPITAHPYWDEKSARLYSMKPAGAIFPFDVSGKRIVLSWFGGVEAFMYAELAKACDNSSVRHPHYFDWRRFRALFESSDIDEAVKADPWLVDWKTFCEKTAVSGFDRRRIKAMERETVDVPVAGNSVWVGTSPFAAPIYEENGSLSLMATENIDVYFSKQGTIKITKGVWMLTDF